MKYLGKVEARPTKGCYEGDTISFYVVDPNKNHGMCLGRSVNLTDYDVLQSCGLGDGLEPVAEIEYSLAKVYGFDEPITPEMIDVLIPNRLKNMKVKTDVVAVSM